MGAGSGGGGLWVALWWRVGGPVVVGWWPCGGRGGEAISGGTARGRWAQGSCRRRGVGGRSAGGAAQRRGSGRQTSAGPGADGKPGADGLGGHQSRPRGTSGGWEGKAGGGARTKSYRLAKQWTPRYPGYHGETPKKKVAFF
ncbi:glycine-rich cell wall structural protein-like [Cryptomeria japonica]|uniref:glycine-rich cell wall structural protein-like n=1 Tax=Cryptomeria japonica TaxID=3369 RepID=UPI0027DAB38E|nr:glycine-rich cell wall structural protein-like [Cryptomeria japonica]